METMIQTGFLGSVAAIGGWMLWQYLLAVGVSALVFAGCLSFLEGDFSYNRFIGQATNIVGILSLVLIPMGVIAFLLELFSAIDTAGGGGAVEWYQVVGVAMVVAAVLSIPVKIHHNRGLVGWNHRRNPVIGEIILLAIGLILVLSNLILGLIGLLEWYQMLGVAFLLGGIGGLVFSRELDEGGAYGLGGYIWIGVALLLAGPIVGLTGDIIEGLPFFWQLVISFTVFYFTIGIGWVAGMGTEMGADYWGSWKNAVDGPIVGLMIAPVIVLVGILPLSAFITLIAILDRSVG